MSKKPLDILDQVHAINTRPNYTIGDILELMDSDPDIDGAIIGSFTERMDCYAKGINGGFFTVDEVRKLERLPKLEQ